MKKIILKFSCLLLIGELFIWWLFFYSPFDIPIRPFIFPINVHGLLLFILMLLIIIYSLKSALKRLPAISILKLTCVGTFIVCISEIIFQSFRQMAIETGTLDEHLFYFFKSAIGMSLFGAAISFMVAFHLVIKNTGKLFLIIFGFLVLVNLL